MQAVKHVDDLLETPERHVREHLAVDKLACDHDLGAIGGHEVDAVCHGREELPQRIEPAARGNGKANASLVELLDKFECLGRHLRVLVEQRAIHVRCYQLDHIIGLPFQADPLSAYAHAPLREQFCKPNMSREGYPLHGRFRGPAQKLYASLTRPLRARKGPPSRV